MEKRRSICLLLGGGDRCGDRCGDADGVGDGDGDGDGGGDGDVLAHLVIPKGEQMKPSCKFKWHEGDQYVYHWSLQQVNQETATATEMTTEMEMSTVMETETETYWRAWSSRKVSK